MTRPGWARTCTCGKTELGLFCSACNAFSGGMPDEVAHHTGPRPKLERPANLAAPRTVAKKAPTFRGGTLRH